MKMQFTPPPMSNHHRSGNAEESLEAALRQSVRKMQETEAMRVI